MVEDSTTLPDAIEERWVQVDGHAIPYLSAGDSGPTVVMVHGVGGTRWEWVESMAALASSHRVLAPDLIGFGDSPRPDVIYSPAYLGEFLVTFLDAVGIDRVTLIGHSLGGRVCLETALRAPDAVEGLALIAPLGFGKLSPLGRLLSAGAWWANRLLRRRQPFPRLDVHVEEPDMSIFSGIRCDTLLIWGSRDIYFPLAYSARALRAIPRSSLCVYEGAGHAAHRSHVERFTSNVQDFIGRRE